MGADGGGGGSEMRLTGTILIFGAAHTIPIFLVGAGTNNRFLTLLAAAGMSVVAFSFGGEMYTVVDMVFIVLATLLCFWVIGDQVKTDKLYKSQCDTIKVPPAPEPGVGENKTTTKPINPHNSKSSDSLSFIVIPDCPLANFYKFEAIPERFL